MNVLTLSSIERICNDDAAFLDWMGRCKYEDVTIGVDVRHAKLADWSGVTKMNGGKGPIGVSSLVLVEFLAAVILLTWQQVPCERRLFPIAKMFCEMAGSLFQDHWGLKWFRQELRDNWENAIQVLQTAIMASRPLGSEMVQTRAA